MAVMDIRMPGMSGLECAKVLWHEMSVPCVVLSAYSDHEHVVDAQEAGVFGYLLKPLGTDALRVSLQTAWARALDDASHRKRIAELELTLASRKVVEQAKWKLIEVRGLTEPQAHRVLQKAARSDRRPLLDVAQEVLDNPSHPLLRGN
jgi:response regulator NasT